METLTYSFIIPCYNEEKDIGNTIDACLRQKYNGEYEIILIDDASKDNTSAVICRYLNKSNKLTFIKNDCNKGVSYSRNRGIQKASGDILIFLNADELPDEIYLTKINCLFQRGADYVFPQTIVENDTTSYGFYRQAYRNSTYTRNNMIMWSQGFACRKKVIIEAGMFNTSYPGCGGEDWDLVSKIDKLTYCRVTDFSIIVKHKLPEKTKEIIWHMFNRGRGTANYQLIYCNVNPLKFMTKKLAVPLCLLFILFVSPICFFLAVLPGVLKFILKSYEMTKRIEDVPRLLLMNTCNLVVRNLGYYYTMWRGVKMKNYA